MHFKSIALLALALLQSASALAQLACDASAVKLNNKGTTILVEPTGGDDTANVQCALDEAIDLQVPAIKLQAGTFNLGGLEALDFAGSLEGNSRSATIVRPIPEGVDCASQQGRGMQTAWLKFIGGAAQLRSMTIDTTGTTGLCDAGSRTTHLVHFTGRNDTPDCAADVIQSAVDRVDFIDDAETAIKNSGASESYRTAITANGEDLFSECHDRLLGGFKLNRSTFNGMLGGVLVTMVGSAQVDVNFNEFNLLGNAVELRNSNISATVLRNSFELTETTELFGEGSFFRGTAMVVSFDSQPKVDETRVSFENNTVNIQALAGINASSAVRATSPAGQVNVNLSVRGNRFEFSPEQQDIGSPNSRRSLELSGVNNASVAGNRVIGNGGLMIVFPSVGMGGNGNAFTGNRFNTGSPTIPTWNISFSAGASNNTVGPGQAATIWDNDGDNFLSDDGNDILFQNGP